MAHIEVDSFVTKFKYLWHSGFKTSLIIEAENGEALVTLKSNLGVIQPPHHGGPQRGQFHRYRGPSYQRRQEKRQASRTAAGLNTAEEVENTNSELSVSASAEQAEPAKEEVKEVVKADKAETNNEDITAEKADKSFYCELCDFKSNWENGLNVHMARKHSKIDQVDGITDSVVDDEKYADTKRYWETGILGTVYQTFLDANEIIENSDFNKDVKGLEKSKILEARKDAFGENFRYVPPWKRK